MTESPRSPESERDTGRRRFLASGAALAMTAGLAAGYGSCFAAGIRFLYPAGDRPRRWQYLAVAEEVGPGAQILYEAPDGSTIVVARQGGAGTAEDFIALSDVCPHMGCKVHWEPHNDRFFCPCHNGVFDPGGRGIAGPPGDEGLWLARYELKIEEGLLYIRVPMGGLGERS